MGLPILSAGLLPCPMFQRRTISQTRLRLAIGCVILARIPHPLHLPPRPPATARQREFLAGGTAGLDTTDAVSIISGANLTLTLDSARYNGEPLGGDGDASDGYGLLIDTVATNSFVVYAGLLSDTDLGRTLDANLWKCHMVRADSNLSAWHV